MAARTLPTMPSWLAGQKITATALNQITTYSTFWANPPAFRMTQQIAQSVPNNAWTQITCDTSARDSDSGRAAGTPFSYTIPAGMTAEWQFGWQLPWANNGTGSRNSGIRKNGVAISGYTSYAPLATNAGGGAGWTDPIMVNAGDVMSLWGYQSSGGALSTAVAADSFPIFWGRLVSLANP